MMSAARLLAAPPGSSLPGAHVFRDALLMDALCVFVPLAEWRPRVPDRHAEGLQQLRQLLPEEMKRD